MDYRNLFIREQLNNCDGVEVCSDEHYTYYNALVNGMVIMFAQATHQPSARRLFYLSNNFAKMLGFFDHIHMCRNLKIKARRRLLSVARLVLILNRNGYEV